MVDMTVPHSPEPFSPELAAKVLGAIGHIDDPNGRLPLAFDFESQTVKIAEDLEDPASFNVIGSIVKRYGNVVLNDTDDSIDEGAVQHLPVFAINQSVKTSCFAGLTRHLFNVLRPPEEAPFHYANNWMGPYLRTLGIGLEVFERTSYTNRSGTRSVVEAISLTYPTDKAPMSLHRTAHPLRSDLYLHGVRLSWTDYSELIKDFAEIGLVRHDWAERSLQIGMAAVAAPWATLPDGRGHPL